MRLCLARLAAAVFALALVSGCSNKVERLVGNERLIRGPEGLGTTTFQTSIPDRDTYVTPGTANYGPIFLVGQTSTFQARAFFKFAKFNLPDTTRLGFTADSVYFEVIPDTTSLRNQPGGPTQFHLGGTSQALADSGAIAWPGPASNQSFASGRHSFGDTLRLNLGESFGQFKGWALDPSSAPAFILETLDQTGIWGFRKALVRFRVTYFYQQSGNAVFASVTTPVTFGAYLHSPLNPPPTGTEPQLLLGGGFEPSVAIRGPVPAVGPGASVNELRFVFQVTDSIPAVDGITVLHNAPPKDATRVAFSLDVYQITGDWPETATDISQIPHGAIPIESFLSLTAEPGDSLSIPLPISLARVWFQAPATNYGVLISVRNANVNPGVVLGSRESAKPPVLRLSTTSTPPGRL